LELQFGEGGTDSKMFVDDLLATYVRYATSLKFNCEILTEEDGHAILKVIGAGVWKAFKNEGGKHVVQRVPPTERSGRRQTSIISVAVLPLPPENKVVSIPEKDLIIKTQCGKQGAGGQHANKTASAVRMTHVPTGFSVVINGRCQMANKKEALSIIAARVTDFENQESKTQYANHKEQQLKGATDKIGGRGEKRRTYNFIRGQVVDHVLNKETNNIKEFMKGNFSVLFGE
jgi:peptide chain release factor 1